jgi:hypothetical protein
MIDSSTHDLNRYTEVSTERFPQILLSNELENNQREQSCIRPDPKITHPQTRALEDRLSQLVHPITAEEIKQLAKTIFREKERGLTYVDLVKGPYRRVETAVRARNILQYHRKRGNLYTIFPITIPQQFFAEKGHAELAAYYNKKTTYRDPTEVRNYAENSSYPVPGSPGLLAQRLSEVIASQEAYIENLKLENLADAVQLVANDVDGLLPVGLHNIRIHLRIDPAKAPEFYHERLAHIPASTTRDKIKRVEFRIDGFLVQCFVYPRGFVDIQVPCTQRPFPIVVQAPEVMTSLLNDFGAQIRYGLVREASDYSGQVVPPIHCPSWELSSADYNWDIPTTLIGFAAMPKLSFSRFAKDVHLRYYPKQREADGRLFIRLERASRPFPKEPEGANHFGDAIGRILVDTARETRRVVSGFGGGA